MKEKILIVYYGMIVGGSTTSLIALLNCLDKDKYDVDLQLLSNTGALFDQIPSHIHLLSPAIKYTGYVGKAIRIIKGLTSGALIKAWLVNLRLGKKGLSEQVLADFYVDHVSRTNPKEYDIAIGFLEGWPVRYVAKRIHATKKFGWLHSTFANIAPIPELEKEWMEQVDRIVFVSDACTEDFKNVLPCMANKAITIENITDSSFVRKMSEETDKEDKAYDRFASANCFKIITVCRITINVKGLDRIIQCAKRLKEEKVNFLWYIVGDGPDMGALNHMINDADVADCLVPVGIRLNPYPFIKAADIMCMPSRYEGKPMVITESMILGVPPVVTEYLSAHYQIKDKVDGLVVPNNDNDIIDVVLDCSRNKEKINSMRLYLDEHEYGNVDYIKNIRSKLFE